jgi:cytochrome c oxidase assembly protein subunit 11
MKLSRNFRLSLGLLGIVVAMVGLSFAAVPLYRVFCAATGFDGTTRRSETAVVTISEQMINVRFDASVSPELPWRFFPMQKQVRVRLGEPKVIYYRAENLSSETITGQATFNVLPLNAGQFFNKIQCFCFEEQTLKPGQGVDMAVQFYVDPALAQNPDVKDATAITLSYTFFRAAGDQPASAQKLSQLPAASQPAAN